MKKILNLIPWRQVFATIIALIIVEVYKDKKAEIADFIDDLKSRVFSIGEKD